MESVVAAWERGPRHLKDHLHPLEEAERWLAIRSLLSDRPESSTGPLCELLEKPPLRLQRLYIARVHRPRELRLRVLQDLVQIQN